MLKQLKAIFFGKKSEPIPNGLGVPELAANFVKSEHVANSAQLKAALNTYFQPKIKTLGFQGKDFYYSKETSAYTQALFIWMHRGGGAIQVDLLVKFKSIPYPKNNELAKEKPLRHANSEFHFRLSPNNKELDFVPDNWFWLLGTTEESLQKIADDIWRVFELRGITYFNQFEEHQKYLSGITPKNLSEFPDFRLQNYVLRNQTDLLYFMFCYWKNAGEPAKANEFALVLKSNLASLPNSFYQSILDKFLEENETKRAT